MASGLITFGSERERERESERVRERESQREREKQRVDHLRVHNSVHRFPTQEEDAGERCHHYFRARLHRQTQRIRETQKEGQKERERKREHSHAPFPN